MGHRPGSAHSWLPLFTPLSSHLWGAGVGQPLIHLLVCSFIPLIHFRCYFPVFHLCEFITERVAREVNTQFSVSMLSVVTGEFLGCWESPLEELRRTGYEEGAPQATSRNYLGVYEVGCGDRVSLMPSVVSVKLSHLQQGEGA